MPPGKKNHYQILHIHVYIFQQKKQHETMAVKKYTAEHTVAEPIRLERLQQVAKKYGVELLCTWTNSLNQQILTEF